MSLRAKAILLFLVTAFVPLGALGFVVRTSLVQGLEDDHRRQLESRVAAATRALEVRERDDTRAVEALCEHDLLVDRTLLQRQGDRFGPTEEQRLSAQLPQLMAGRGFDVLHLLDVSDERGRVLGAAHYPARAGANVASLLDAMAREGNPFVASVRILDDEGSPRDTRALLSGCTKERDGTAIALIAGRELGDDFGERLLGDVAPVHFALVEEGQEAELAGTGAPTLVRRFGGEGGLSLIANIDDEPLQREIAALTRRSLYVAGAAFALALLLGLLATWTLTRPLEELEQAARRVGSGDFESQVAITRTDEVGDALRAFNEMTKELATTRDKLLRAERIAAWREVARRIAHEIKNPLQPIQMEIETMRKLHERKHASFDEEFGPSTQMILDEVRRLDTMVTEFSRFARLPRPRATSNDVAEIAQHVVDLHGEGDVHLDAQLASVSVRCDRDQLTQVLVNLVQNAADAAKARHGAAGAVVRIEVDAEGEGARVIVADNGPGIAPEDRMKVFEPYYTTKSSGTGLGLAIVHRIVGDHGGTIDIVDGIEGGAAFSIFLPEAGPPEAIVASISDGSLPLGRP